MSWPQRVLLTPAGLSGLVDRLERAKLVERRPCDGDARGTYAVVTAEGRELARACPPHPPRCRAGSLHEPLRRRGAGARRAQCGSGSHARAAGAESPQPLPSSHAWRQVDSAGTHLRHPHRSGSELVPGPVPLHLVADRLLPVRRCPRATTAPPLRWLPRAPCCSSSPSCCTSWAMRWWRSGTGSRSRASTCGCSAGSRRCRRTPRLPGVEFRVAIAGPVVTLLIAVLCTGLGILAAGGTQDYWNAVAFDAEGTAGASSR